MKSLARVLEEMLAIWLVCLLAGSSCAVFYTKSDNNDFPRLGRRSIFTDSHLSLPRIGRRSHPNQDTASEAAAAAAVLSAAVYDPASFQSTPLKRGIFTAGGPSFPRVGRGGGQQTSRSKKGELSPAVKVTSLEDPDVGREEEEEGDEREREVVEMAAFRYPLGLLFFDFDKDGDKRLTREEFVQGMTRAREDGTLYR